MRKQQLLVLLLIGCLAPLLSACASGESMVSNLANEIMNVLTFIGVGVAVVTLMLAGMSIIVNRATGSSRGISENVKTYLVIGGLVIALLLLPRIISLSVESMQGTLTPNVNALDKVWGGK